MKCCLCLWGWLARGQPWGRGLRWLLRTLANCPRRHQAKELHCKRPPRPWGCAGWASKGREPQGDAGAGRDAGGAGGGGKPPQSKIICAVRG